MFSFAIFGLRAVVNVIVVGLYGFMCVAVLAQVLGRYLFDFSISGAVESATFGQVWMVLLGAGVAMRLNMHNSMDLIAQRLSKRTFRILLILSAGACLWFLAITILGSLPLLEIGEFQTSPALQIPMSIPYLAVPIGCAYLALELVLSTVERWRSGGPPEQTVDFSE